VTFNAEGVERRARRAGPEGVSRWRRIIERSSMESPAAEKQKPSHRLGSLNSGARTRTNAEGVERRARRAGPEGVSRWRRIIERSSMESPAAEKQKPSHRLGSLNSGARTRTNAEGVERRARRAGPEGVSRWRRIIERSSMESPAAEKQKPSHRLGSLNSGAGLGIISTINSLFVLGFVGICRKQRPHKGPHKKSLCFCDGCHENKAF
jgi:hypothetical protein